MENSIYTVLLGLGGENGNVIYNYEKDYKLYVWKEYSEDFPGMFAYNFYHLSDDAKSHIPEHTLDLWMAAKGIDVTECEAAAAWFILMYAKLPNLRYAYPALGLEIGEQHLFAFDLEGNRYDL